MHITIVQGAFLPVPPLLGGAMEKLWFGLAPEFVRRGHRVTYISRQFESLPAQETLAGVEHLRVPSFDAPKNKVLYRALDFLYAWRVRRRLPVADIIVTNTIWLPMLLRDERAGRLCVQVARYPKGQMRLYRHAARLHTLSSPVAEAIRGELPAVAQKVKVIPPDLGSEPPPLDAAALAAPRPPVILYLGRIHPEKGLDILLRAFGQFLEQRGGGSDWRLQLAGPVAARMGGGGEQYQAQLETLSAPFRDRVDWLGFVSGEALRDVYRQASIFVYPSVAEKGETFGLAPLEAMALGCPAVVSDLACFRDFIVDGETGLVFDHRGPDPAANLGAKLQQLASDPALRARLVRQGYDRAREFTREKVAALYLEDFARLLAERAGAEEPEGHQSVTTSPP